VAKKEREQTVWSDLDIQSAVLKSEKGGKGHGMKLRPDSFWENLNGIPSIKRRGRGRIACSKA